MHLYFIDPKQDIKVMDTTKNDKNDKYKIRSSHNIKINE